MSHVLGAVLAGVEGVPIEVEVRLSSQLPRIDIVGLPEAAVRESAARVRAAVASTGHRFPERRVTVNLAPAGLRKTGAGLDLPIAVGILAAAGALDGERLEGLGLVGELALDGRVRTVRGALSRVMALREAGCRTAVVAADSAAEAALAPDIAVLAARDLAGLLGYLQTGRTGPGIERARPGPAGEDAPQADLADVRGQQRAKRVLEVAAAGGHPLLMSGPPGAGKTMLARRLPGLLPPLAFDEALEATRIHGVAGRLGPGTSLLRSRPFRAPHHAASRAGLLGGGVPARPGEVSLAHRGVLFLDELPEFDRSALEALRQVLEERRVVISRAAGTWALPADFQLVAARNPCPCGWRWSRWRECRCSDAEVARYRARVSGPLLDRLDLHLAVPAVAWRELDAPAGDAEPSARVRERVCAARRRASRRLAGFGCAANGEIPDRHLDAAVAAGPDARALLGKAVERLRLSARGARRVLRVARTLADLDESEAVGPGHVAEALSYRRDEGE